MFRALRGQRPYILEVAPFFPPFQSVLKKIVQQLIATDRARMLIDDCPDLEPIKEYYPEVYMYDIFAKAEEWMDANYRFADAHRMAGHYDMAYKHAVCCHIGNFQTLILMIRSVQVRLGGSNVLFHGLTPDLAGMYEAYFDEPIREPVRVACKSRHLINFLISFSVIGHTVVWILMRTRLRVLSEAYFLAVDYVSDARDLRLINELSTDEKVLIVLRNTSVYGQMFLDSIKAPHTVCDQHAGRFSVGQAIMTTGMVIRDEVRLLFQLGWLEPHMFFTAAALPKKRVMMRGLFIQYRPKFFWGRDESNSEHAVRRQELQRVGAKSFGVQHGSPTHAIVQPMWRYISLDVFYVFGRLVYDRHYRRTWAKDMTVKAVGSFGTRREDYAMVGRERRRDILVMISLYYRNNLVVETVRQLAEAFPDRKILLQIKPRFRDTDIGREFIEKCTDGLSNVDTVDAMIMDLFAQVQYAFSDPSTTVVEAIQFGLNSYFLDMSPDHKACIYREFPSLCINTPDEAVETIKQLESGVSTYPRAEFSGLVETETVIFHDVVRSDMDLQPRSTYFKAALLNEPCNDYENS